MRLLELANALDTAPVELMKQAQVLEIEVYSALTQLDASEASRLKAQYLKQNRDELAAAQAARASRRAAKSALAKEQSDAALERESQALKRHRDLALKAAEEQAKAKQAPAKEDVPDAQRLAAPGETGLVKPAPSALSQATPKAEAVPVAPEPQPEPKVDAPAAESKPQTVAAPVRQEPQAKPAVEPPKAESPAPAEVPYAQRLAGPGETGLVRPAPKKVATTAPKSSQPPAPKPAHEVPQEVAAKKEVPYAQRLAGPGETGLVRPAPKKEVPYAQRLAAPGETGLVRPAPKKTAPVPSPAAKVQPQRPAPKPGKPPFGKQSPAKLPPTPPAAPASPAAGGKTISIPGALTVKELAEKMEVRPNRLIADLMSMNILAAINQRIEPGVAEKIASKYGFRLEVERARRSAERKPIIRSENADDEIPEDTPESLLPRPPVVTFLGHVDHGKTSLMDRIRNTHVAAGEAGGITQAIGAYTIEICGRPITFLDTPGHAAFSAMRARGANLTDIAVIIIAADDGIMPQTKEAIAHARRAGVQILVAINKCDLPTANPMRVRQMLQAEGLTPEEWGGDIVVCEVSAQTGDGIDHLLEMILLQADVLELTANPNRRANGTVIEAQVEQGLGPTATLLVTGGTLKVGDVVLCDEYYGKIRGLIDERGRRVKSAGPSIAVRCMGLSGVPEAGAEFRVMLNEKRARQLAERAAQENKVRELSTQAKSALTNWAAKLSEDGKPELAVIVKADCQGSAEAVVEALHGLKSEKVTLNIVSDGVGNVAPADVQRAAGGCGIIIGFNVSCEPGVQSQARHDGVRINTFRIIYELIEHVKQCMLDLIPPEYKEVIRGHAFVKQVFEIGKKGKIAGCQMVDGTLRLKDLFRIYRGKEILFTGKLSEMRHFQEEVTEVNGSKECGLRFQDFEGFTENDSIECYEMEMLPKSL
ncbi:MAG: translation initiation factor IF-2 [Kiritimatiellia bacterium]|nr:translation initiation factor IF-2 [Kiritimatiellia bacterium]